MSIRIWAYDGRVWFAPKRCLGSDLQWIVAVPTLIVVVGATLAACGFANAAPPTVSAPTSAPTTQPTSADRATYLADVRVLLCEKWPKNWTINIVCHGHRRTALLLTRVFPHAGRLLW
ncbi:MAG TPA: hypothetical protein VGI81_21590 [Tepidisphaeraceae bacterium]|jgi:hypothetical protein